MTPLVLGSTSPRRQDILNYFKLPYEQAAPDFDEDLHPFNGCEITYVKELARLKGKSLLLSFPDRFILSADTIVTRKGKVFGKPKDRAHAKDILSSLVGKEHLVYTALSLTRGNQVLDEMEQTRVFFQDLSPEEIDLYLDHITYADKAGAYQIQQTGSLIVRRIEGCHTNVLGLPVAALHRLLSRVKINLFHWMRPC